MNIKGIERFLNIEPPPSNKVQQGDGFKQIFEQTLSQINTVNSTTPVDSKTAALAHGDRVLSLLDQYIGKLADPSTSLKEIHPLVTSIEKTVIDMQSGAANTHAHDKDLNRFLNDIAVTANVAVLKYQRGDFV